MFRLRQNAQFAPLVIPISANKYETIILEQE